MEKTGMIAALMCLGVFAQAATVEDKFKRPDTPASSDFSVAVGSGWESGNGTLISARIADGMVAVANSKTKNPARFTMVNARALTANEVGKGSFSMSGVVQMNYPKPQAWAGLVINWKDPENYYQFRYNGVGTVQLARCVNGKVVAAPILSLKNAFVPVSDRPYELRVSSSKPGVFDVAVRDTMTGMFVFSKNGVIDPDVVLINGLGGFYSNNEKTRFDNFSLTFESAANWAKAERMEKFISEFELQDRQSPPPENAILCIGSSSMRHWNENIATDLSPLTVIPRGFGGSTINDVIYYFDRVVLPYKPRAILLYEGDNDLAHWNTAETVVTRFKDFFAMVNEQLPGTRMYVISVKPSILRQPLWPVIQELNGLLEEECSRNDLLTFIDASTALLGADGKAQEKLLLKDKIHMNAEGYKVWTRVIQPVLLEREGSFE